MNYKKTILLVFIILSLSSCKGLIYKLLAPKHPELKILYNEEKEKTFAFIPMVHIAKPVFFKETKEIVDSFRQKGFVIYYESVNSPKIKTATAEEDTLLRKFRRLVGFQAGDYTNKNNESTPNFMKNGKYVMQTAKNTGIKRDDCNVDLSAYQIIRGYEKKYGEIKLNQCDWNTKFFGKYDCHEDELNNFYALNTLREEYIFKKSIQSSHTKILMIYGKQHYLFLYPDYLKKGYKLISE
jgi:hypothetical protein